jgi:hypothetical protein
MLTQDTIYNTNYDLINNYLENSADEEQSLKIMQTLFEQFYQKSLNQLSSSSIECMLKYGYCKVSLGSAVSLRHHPPVLRQPPSQLFEPPALLAD